MGSRARLEERYIPPRSGARARRNVALTCDADRRALPHANRKPYYQTCVAVNPELEARLVAQPEIETYLVYGDWLSEHGDPRGELVAVQARLLANPGDPRLRAREASLIAANRSEWLGPLATLTSREFFCTWSYGFIDYARINLPEELADSDHAYIDVVSKLEALLELPHIELLRDLDLCATCPWTAGG